jgi:hypothetical protein
MAFSRNPESDIVRKFLGLTLLVVAAACSQEQSAPTSPEPLATGGETLNLSADGQYVLGRLLVRFRPGAPKGTILSAQQARALREILLGIEEIEVPVGYEKAIALALQRTGWVEFAEPDYVRTFGIPCATGDCTAPTDTYLGYKWDLHNDGTITNSLDQNLANTGAADADMDWLEAFSQIGSLTGSARIGIIDTGVDQLHPDFGGRVVAGADFVSGNPKPFVDKIGHGTHVAGIAAASGNDGQGVPGVAWGPNITIITAKVCRDNGCPTSAIVDGIEWAVDNGANVLNISLGGPSGSSTEQAALQYARANGVLPFCAAGNESGPVSYPAAFPECVAVSATDWSDNLASYSNFGSQVDLAAPGGDDESPDGYSYILSTGSRKDRYCENSTNCYLFMAGTSMATPQAVGLAALLHALGVTDDDAKLQIMQDTADDLGPNGNDTSFGAGRINVFAAVVAASGPPGPAQCNNGVDDDVDGATDYPADPGCSSLADTSESPDPPPPAQCGNGADDDLDGATDFPADPGCTSLTDDSESPDPPPASISLTATAESKGVKRRANLVWSGASGANVEVWRNGASVATTANDGQHKDSLPNGTTGTFTYKICQTGGSPCSGEKQVTF